MALKDQLDAAVDLIGVVNRRTLTYMVRTQAEIQQKDLLKRDYAVENYLQQRFKAEELSKERVGNRVAYFKPTGKRGPKPHVAHDMYAGLVASRLYADLKERAAVQLHRKPLDDRLMPDWTLDVNGGDFAGTWFIEYHTAKNTLSNLRSKFAAYAPHLGEDNAVLIVTQAPVSVELPTAAFLLALLADVLKIGDAWREPLWLSAVGAGKQRLAEALKLLREQRRAEGPEGRRKQAAPLAKKKITYKLSYTPPAVPVSLAKQLLWLSDEIRSSGINIFAMRGVGKSRLMGRIIAWQDAMRGTPTIVIDPVGGTIDNFLDKLARAQPEVRRQLLKRVVYVDMSGRHGNVVPFPLYYRIGNEGLFEISQRWLDLVKAEDPWLVTASVEGWNALWETGTVVGMMLAALGYQITEAEHLLLNHKAWSSRFTQAIRNDPDAREAVNWFNRHYKQWKDRDGTRLRRTQSFRVKSAPFRLDPTLRAMCGASKPGVDWHRFQDWLQIVLLDFRHVLDSERRRFLIRWAFKYVFEFIKSRGPGRHIPISVIIDELSEFTNWETLGVDTFSAELDALINRYGRNNMAWVSGASQGPFQHPPSMQKTLLSMGTQIIGAVSDPEDAEQAAQQFYRYDPKKAKRVDPVWMGLTPPYEAGPGWYYHPGTVPTVVDDKRVDFTPEEQLLLNSYKLLDQGRFEFLVRPARAEGDVRGGLHRVSIANFDRDIYPNETIMGLMREKLSKLAGRPIADIEGEIAARLSPKKAAKIRSVGRRAIAS